jgi:hypothetical protein
MRAYDPHFKKLAPFLDDLSMLQFVISPDRQWMAYTEYPSLASCSNLEGRRHISFPSGLLQ